MTSSLCSETVKVRTFERARDLKSKLAESDHTFNQENLTTFGIGWSYLSCYEAWRKLAKTDGAGQSSDVRIDRSIHHRLT